MGPRTVGVEEELLLVDPDTRAAAPRAAEVLRQDRLRGEGQVDRELFRHQVEIRSEAHRDLGAVLAELAERRRAAGEAAEAVGQATAACASAPIGATDPVVTPSRRYEEMVATYGDLARSATTCGMHVHVGIGSDEEGVGCLDRIAPWLPVLLAISANSPYADGRDTGYMSFRSQLWSRWPSAGPTEAFGSVAAYRVVCDQMIASGAARDAGMLYFDARLAQDHPTLEVRVLDVATELEVTGLLAALVRGLVAWAAEHWAEGRPPAVWRAEELRAATWRSARYGLSERLVHPFEHRLAPAGQVVDDLLGLVAEALGTAGDTDRVTAGVARVRAASGADRQRAARDATGSVAGVVDDVVRRTRASWGSPSAPHGGSPIV